MRVPAVASDLYRYLATLHGWLLMGLSTLIAGLVFVPATRLAARFWPAADLRFADVVHWGLALYQRSVLYMRVEVEGAERRLDATRVLVANHQSWLDPLVLMGIERRLQGPVRRYMIDVPVFGWIVRQCGFYPGEAGELPSFEDVRACVDAARSSGGSLLFFPEGTRGQRGEVGPFRRGAFRAAVDHGLWLQPVVIEGLDRVLPRRGPIVQTPGRTRVRVRYLEAVPPPADVGEGPERRVAVRELAEETRRRMVAELEGMRREEAPLPGSASEPLASQ